MKLPSYTMANLLHAGLRAICYLALAICMISGFANVVLRYAFSSGFLWLQDIGLYCFGILIILAIPVSLLQDRHVRVDIWRVKQSHRQRSRMDSLGFLVFLVPLFGLLIWRSVPDVIAAWQLSEGSPQIGGLPMYYLVKAILPLGSLLIVIAGLYKWVLLPATNPDQPDIGA